VQNGSEVELSQSGGRKGYCGNREARTVCGNCVGRLLGVEGGKESVGKWFESGVRGWRENPEANAFWLRHCRGIGHTMGNGKRNERHTPLILIYKAELLASAFRYRPFSLHWSPDIAVPWSSSKQVLMNLTFSVCRVRDNGRKSSI